MKREGKIGWLFNGCIFDEGIAGPKDLSAADRTSDKKDDILKLAISLFLFVFVLPVDFDLFSIAIFLLLFFLLV